MTNFNLAKSWRQIAVAGVIIAALGILTFYFILPSLGSVSTDDAYVQAHLTTITAKIPAYVQALSVDDNAQVKAGDLLVELDARDYAVQVDVARANLSAAEGKRKEADHRATIADAGVVQANAELQAVRANASLADVNLRRLNLISDQRAVSSERVDTAKAAAEKSRADIAAAKARIRSAVANASLARAEIATADASVSQARAALAQAQLNLSYTKIAASEGGTVANKEVEKGNYVQPGQSLFAIVPDSPFVVANFKESQLQHIKPGQTATIGIDANTSLRLKGHVDSIQRGTGSVFALLPPENATGNFVKVVQRVPVKIVFDDPREAYKWISPGMSAEVKIDVSR